MAFDSLLLEYDVIDCICGASATSGTITAGATTPHGYYVVIHSEDFKAVKNTPAPYTLQSFSKSLQNQFAFDLTQDPERTRHYYKQIACSDLDIPNNPYGEWYEYEVWGRSASGTYNRDTDKLLKVEKFSWVGRRAESRLDISQEQSIAVLAGIAFPLTDKDSTDNISGTWGAFFAEQTDLVVFFDQIAPMISAIQAKTMLIGDSVAETQWSAIVNAAYDSQNSRMQIVAWAEKDGQLYLSTTTCLLTVRNSSGDVVISRSYTPTPNPGTGQFSFSIEDLTLSPDEAYYAVITITKADTNTITSAAAFITWD